MSKLRQRLAREEGFTLIELLVVIVIIGILLAIAVPSYLGFKGRAEEKAAGSNVRSAIPSAEAYYSDNGDYDGMTFAGLQGSYDSGLATGLVVFGAGQDYCLSFTKGDYTGKVLGPGGQVSSTETGSPNVACTSATG